MRRRIAAGLILALTACTNWHAAPLPTPTSPILPGTGRLRAGVARVEITPPVGLGLAGSGPESRRSTGYRTRLYANAVVLQDRDGERIALVVLDLAHVSTNLHRLVADRLALTEGIGADRLILSATHTHSGPGNFYAERQYNSTVSRIGGYDPRFVDFLVARITNAVRTAVRTMGDAVAASGVVTIEGTTWNRSLGPYCNNTGITACPDSSLAVNRELVMLRVDHLDPDGRTSPLGSYSVFAIHGTSIPSINTLYDGDVHTRAVRHLMERVGTETVHALANGAEGDVAPNVSRDPAGTCDPPAIAPVDPFVAYRGPGTAAAGGIDFVERSLADRRRCIDDALVKIDRVAQTIADSAYSLYTRLRGSLTTNVPIRRVYSTLWLPGADGLCGTPVMGAGGAGGAEGAETRFRGWQWVLFPLIHLAADEGGGSVKTDPKSCQSPKRGLLQALQTKLLVGEHGFPEVAQLTVARIGGLLLAALPGEITTTAAQRFTTAMGDTLATKGWTPGQTAVISLADGFLQYVTTKEEYALQHYEGGSTLYGGRTAEVLTAHLRGLAGKLPPNTRPSPPVTVGAITAYPGPPSEIMPLAGRLPKAPFTDALTLSCRNGALWAEWTDLLPGDLFPHSGSLLELYRGTTLVATDGDGFLEVHLVKQGKTSATWRAYWRGVAAGTDYRLVRPGDAGAADREGRCTAVP